MSQKYPYTNTGDDFLSHKDIYADSYQRQSNAYQACISSSSQEQKCSPQSSNITVDSPVHLPGMALSFLQSFGLDLSDLAHLAELPEHLITVETLPKLLLQVKERKLSSTSSTRPSTSQPFDDTSSPAWEDVDYVKPVEYPIDRTAPPAYPLPPEQVQNWQDRWGNPRQTSSLITGTSGTRSNSISAPNYNPSKDTGPYCDTESLEATPQSFVDSGPRPLLSLKLEPPATTPTKKEASDFNCRTPPAYPNVCCLCDIPVLSTKEWLLHVQGSKHVEGQHKLIRKYPKWDQTVESARRIGGSEVYKVPTRKEASDFSGTVPPVFPYLCVLCNTTIFSENKWSLHVGSGQHSKRQLDLLRRYPEWDGTIQSSRRNDGQTSMNKKDGTAIKHHGNSKMKQAKDKLSSRVVSFTPLPAGEGISSELTAIAKRFGSVKKSLILPNLVYVEMTSLAEAKKLVGHYSVNQLKLKGKLIQVTFACEHSSLRDAEGKTQSLCLHTHGRSSSLSPKRRHSSEKTHSSPKRRRSSERTHSSSKRRRSSERTHSSSKRKHPSERINSSPRRQRMSETTHSSPKIRRSSEVAHSSPQKRYSSERTQSSPKRRHSSERTHSSPPKRYSSERTQSSPKRRHSPERTHSSPQKRYSSERTQSSPKRRHSSERTCSTRSNQIQEPENSRKSQERSSTSSTICNSSSSTAKDEDIKSDEEEKRSVCSNYVESFDSDGDLEGLEVVGDDDGELVHDFDDYEFIITDQENLTSEPMEMKDVHIEEQEKTGKDSPNADTSEALNSLKEAQKFEEDESQEIKTEDNEFPKILESCVILNEFREEKFSDYQEADEPVVSISKPEDFSDRESTSNTTAKPSKSENLKDAVDQPNLEENTERMTENLKETFGKVLEVRNLPSAEDYTDLDFMNIIKRYGDVTHYVLFRSCKKGVVEMVFASDAERVAADSKNQDIALRSNILKIKVSEKYIHVPEEGFNVDSDDEEISKKSNDNQSCDALNGNAESSNESVKAVEPVGTEFVRPVVGYFCNLCNVIYASEEEAKDEHCRSPSHHEKVKEHKEKSGPVGNKK